MISKIIDKEWNFLQQIEHIDGRADCQDDFDTFYIMRSSQFQAWDKEVLESYYQDLLEYEATHRNPMYEKYGYMMATTDPEHYQQIKHTLPIIEDDKSQIMEALIQLQVSWKIAFHNQYPYLDTQARTIFSSDDSIEETSFETYLRGELSTYSAHTLYLYGKMLVTKQKSNTNMITEIMQYTITQYGYQSLDEAQKHIQKQ